MRLDPSNGEPLSAEQVLERSCNGLYCWWGVRYLWSPDGSQLAWVQADAVGLVDLESTEAAFGEPLLRYAVYSTRGDWSWRATLSWSPESDLLLTTTHGPAVGNEPPETSPRFDVSVTAADGAFSTVLAESAGIWSAPRFSPFVVASGTDAEPFPRGYMAYLQARDPYNSINELAQYDLVVADRDGSNRRIVFPEAGQPGLTARDFGQDFAWGPDGRQIALIYQGNLWVVDVQSNVAHQLTLDGGASKPLWVR
jgi:resuscitation-promoting factor RpfB